MEGRTGHLHELFYGQVVLQLRLSPVSPRLGVDGHAVLPLVVEEVAGAVSVGTRVEATVPADGPRAPPVVGYHRLSNGTETTGAGSAAFSRMSFPSTHPSPSLEIPTLLHQGSFLTT